MIFISENMQGTAEIMAIPDSIMVYTPIEPIDPGM